MRPLLDKWRMAEMKMPLPGTLCIIEFNNGSPPTLALSEGFFWQAIGNNVSYPPSGMVKSYRVINKNVVQDMVKYYMQSSPIDKQP